MDEADTRPFVKKKIYRKAGVTASMKLQKILIGIMCLMLSAHATLAQSSDPSDAYMKSGQYYADQKDIEHALADFGKAIELAPNNPDAYAARGLVSLNNNDYTSAIADYSKAIELDPKAYLNYYNRAIAYVNNEEYQKGLADCKKVLAMEPDDADTYVELGLIYERQNQLKNALGCYSKAVSLTPNNVIARGNRSGIYSRLGDHDRAAADLKVLLDRKLTDNVALTWGRLGYQQHKGGKYAEALASELKSIKLDPKINWVRLDLGLVYADQGDWPHASAAYHAIIEQATAEDLYGAVIDLKDSLAKHPKSPTLGKVRAMLLKLADGYMTWYDRGTKSAEKRDYTAAIEAFSKTVLFSSSFAKGYTGRADAYFERGKAEGNSADYEKSIADYTEAIRLGAAEAASYSGRGFANLRADHLDKAIDDFTKAISLDPKDSLGYFCRALAYQRIDHDKAIADLDTSIRLSPDTPEYYSSRASSKNEKRLYDEALADCTKAIELKAEGATVYYERAIAHIGKEEYQQAVVDFNKAIQIEPGVDYYYAHRADAYRSKGDYELALADVDEAIKIDSRYAGAYYRRGLIYQDKRDYKAAITAYNKAIDFEPDNVDYYSRRSVCHLEDSDLENALADAEKAISLDGDSSDAHLARALALAGKGDVQAMAECEKSLTLSTYSNSDGIWYQIGNYMLSSNKIDEAMMCYNKALVLNDKLVSARFQLGLILALKDEWDRSEAQYRAGMTSATADDLSFGISQVESAMKELPDSTSLKKALELLKGATAHSGDPAKSGGA
jgi:tetratricopeptide (TPR) repeat protein